MTPSRVAALILGLVLLTAGLASAADLGCAPVTALSASERAEIRAAFAAAAVPNRPFFGERFFRTELFFGSAKPDGTAVTEAEFKEFLDQCVTPRFPDGLTLLTGLGQFRGAGGLIVQERSMLLILLYPLQTRRVSSLLIEEIREHYKRIFLQESVLRSDRCCEQVGF